MATEHDTETANQTAEPAMFNWIERPLIGGNFGPRIYLSVQNGGEVVEAVEVMIRDLPRLPEILNRIPASSRARLLLEIAKEADAPAKCSTVRSPVGGPPVFQIVPGTSRDAVFTYTGCALESVGAALESGIQGGLNAVECFALAQLVRQVEAALYSVDAVS